MIADELKNFWPQFDKSCSRNNSITAYVVYVGLLLYEAPYFGICSSNKKVLMFIIILKSIIYIFR